MSYTIGQVLYIIPKTTKNIVPVQVIEVISKQVLNSDMTITYLISSGNTHSTLEETAEEVFVTPSQASEALVARATSAIHKLVNDAEQRAKELFPQHITEKVQEKKTKRAQREEFEEARKNSGNVMPVVSRKTMKEVKEREDFNNVSDFGDVLGDDPITVTLPDGTQAKVRMPTT
jgi:uncharacterized membrane protein